jgi:hypothetical protein
MEYIIDPYEKSVKFYSELNPDVPFLVQTSTPEGKPWESLEEMAQWAEEIAVGRQLKLKEIQEARAAKAEVSVEA